MLASFLIATALVAIVAPFLGRAMGRSAGWVLGPALFGLGCLLWLHSGSEPITETYAWMPSLGVEFALRLDGLGLLFGLLVLLIGGAVLAYSARHLGPGPQGGFYGLMSLFAFAMLGLVLADDVIVLFVMWEITTLCSFFLIARSGPYAREPAIRTLLVTGAGGLSLLAAVVVMAVYAGSTQLSVILASDVWANPAFAVTVAVLIAFAAFAKSAQFPFQAWLPDAMAAATPVSAYLHAAAMVKAGIYLMMRFSGVLGEVPAWNIMLITAGLITAVMGAISALRRNDLKSMMAYSTVSQLGFLTAVIGIGTPEALAAAAVHTVAHALFKSALFMLTGVIDQKAGTRDLRLLSGLRTAMPVTTVLFTVSALSMAGVPPLLGFISKESMFEALLHAPGPGWTGVVVGGIAVVAAVLTFAYAAKMVLGAFGGPAMTPRPREAELSYLIPVALPAMTGVALGLWVTPLNRIVFGAASDSTATTIDSYLSLWHGINPALLMSVFVVIAGLGMVAGRARVDRLITDRTAPFNALRAVDRARVAIIRFGDRVGDSTRSDAPSRHLTVPIAWLLVITTVGLFTIGDLPSVVGEPTRTFDWVLVALVAIGVVGTVSLRSRVAVIAVIGVVGFAVTVWFLVLGAADVALTQLLVEILTVVVIVLLLRRLPTTFRRSTRRRAIGAAALAVAAGTATTLAVLALTGRRELSRAGEYFLNEAESQTGGTNVVNTILVDFRALDTLGEITVLAIAGVAILVLLQARPLLPLHMGRFRVRHDSPLQDPYHNTVFLRTLNRFAGPIIVVLSLWFLLRGHNDPGGGFIAGLIGGAGFALSYLSAPSDIKARARLRYLAVVGGGVVVSGVTGFLGFLEGSFLRPLHLNLGDFYMSTALLFDIGVYMVVVGVVVIALNKLGTPNPPGAPNAAAASADSVSARVPSEERS